MPSPSGTDRRRCVPTTLLRVVFNTPVVARGPLGPQGYYFFEPVKLAALVTLSSHDHSVNKCEGDNEAFLGDVADQNIIDDEDIVMEERQDVDLREFYICKNKETRWYVEPNMARASLTQRYNIISTFHRPGPKGHAKNAKTHLESIECIIDENMFEKIVSYTNIYITKLRIAL
ncbi:hypothetical protein J6590_092949 [Homalodisca vitripennis]|nr:hypothetical protein J6590_092949 [Homalodisca vitripennis]